MNEIDLTTKIEGLKKAIAEHKDFAGNYEDELKKTEQQQEWDIFLQAGVG